MTAVWRAEFETCREHFLFSVSPFGPSMLFWRVYDGFHWNFHAIMTQTFWPGSQWSSSSLCFPSSLHPSQACEHVVHALYDCEGAAGGSSPHQTAHLSRRLGPEKNAKMNHLVVLCLFHLKPCGIQMTGEGRDVLRLHTVNYRHNRASLCIYNYSLCLSLCGSLPSPIPS